MKAKSQACNRTTCQQKASTFYMTPAPMKRDANGSFEDLSFKGNKRFFQKRNSLHTKDHDIKSLRQGGGETELRIRENNTSRLNTEVFNNEFIKETSLERNEELNDRESSSTLREPSLGKRNGSLNQVPVFGKTERKATRLPVKYDEINPGASVRARFVQ